MNKRLFFFSSASGEMELLPTEVGKAEKIGVITEFCFVHIKVKMYIRCSRGDVEQGPNNMTLGV